MAREQEPPRLKGIHLDLTEQLVTLEAEDGRVARYAFAPSATPSDAPQLPATFETPLPQTAASAEERAPQTKPEKEAKTTLSGRLNTQPKQGRPDRSGRPTAVALLVGHREEDDDWHPYLATFHRQTARIALGLTGGTHLTVEGYIHERSAPTRYDTISVVNIAHYEGKPEKP